MRLGLGLDGFNLTPSIAAHLSDFDRGVRRYSVRSRGRPAKTSTGRGLSSDAGCSHRTSFYAVFVQYLLNCDCRQTFPREIANPAAWPPTLHQLISRRENRYSTQKQIS